MDCLFETKTVLTEEEYIRYNLAVTKKMRRARDIIYGAMILVMLLESVLLRAPVPAIAAAILGLLWLAVVRPLNIRAIKKTFASNKLMKDEEATFLFYETYFVEKTERGEGRVPYDRLDTIIETPQNMYLMIAKNQGYSLVKANFPDGLEEFLRALPVKHK